MAKSAFISIQIIIFGGIVLSTASAASLPKSTAFQVWLATFDPLKSAANTKSTDCVGKPDGFYPQEPDTCSNSYVACYSGVPYPQNCRASWVFDADEKGCVNRIYATSSACTNYPPPSCDDVDEGVFMPTENCGQLYYICIQGEIIFQQCNPGEIFDPVSLMCIDNTGPNACSRPTTTVSTTTTTASTTTASPSTPTTTRPILPTAPCTGCAKIIL